MKNAANVLHQQQHSIELASAISKIRLHFPMHTQCIAVLVTASCSCSDPHSGQIRIQRVSNGWTVKVATSGTALGNPHGGS